MDDSSDDESEMENKPADPKELAKKLVQSGAIVLRKQEPTRTFKRAQTLDRKLSVAPRPPPPLKMKLKRVYNEGPGPKVNMELGDLGDGTSAEMKPKPSRYVCHLPTQPPGSLPGSRSSSLVTSMEAKRSSQQPQPSSSSSANQPSSSSTFRMKAGSSSTAATDWHKLAEANRRRMNETRGDFVDYKRRGLVSYKDLNESSDDDD